MTMSSYRASDTHPMSTALADDQCNLVRQEVHALDRSDRLSILHKSADTMSCWDVSLATVGHMPYRTHVRRDRSRQVL